MAIKQQFPQKNLLGRYINFMRFHKVGLCSNFTLCIVVFWRFLRHAQQTVPLFPTPTIRFYVRVLFTSTVYPSSLNLRIPADATAFLVASRAINNPCSLLGVTFCW